MVSGRFGWVRVGSGASMFKYVRPLYPLASYPSTMSRDLARAVH